MNKFDQFVKHQLKAKYYIRYADDFVILSEDNVSLEKQLFGVRQFLKDQLKLKLHPNKVSLETVSSGVDFLGLVNFADYRVLRTRTKRRMMNRISLKAKLCREELVSRESLEQSRQSYLGMLGHCRGYGVARKLAMLD